MRGNRLSATFRAAAPIRTCWPANVKGWAVVRVSHGPHFPAFSPAFGGAFLSWKPRRDFLEDATVGAPRLAEGLLLPAGRSPDWLKMKNPACSAVKREAEADWGRWLPR